MWDTALPIPLAPPVMKADLSASDMVMMDFCRTNESESELVIAGEVEFTRKEIIAIRKNPAPVKMKIAGDQIQHTRMIPCVHQLTDGDGFPGQSPAGASCPRRVSGIKSGSCFFDKACLSVVLIQESKRDLSVLLMVTSAKIIRMRMRM